MDPGVVQILGAQAKTVAVAPLNIMVELPNELEAATEFVSGALVRHLEIHGKTVRSLEFRYARGVWSASVNEVVASGGARNFQAAARIFVRRVGETIDFDVLVVPSLFIQNAERARSPSLGTHQWDGAQQSIEVSGLPGRYRCIPQVIDASSILVFVYDAEGNEIQSKQSGIELLYTIEAGPGRDPDSIVCKKTPVRPSKGRARAGVARGFFPFLPISPPAQMKDESSP